MANSQEIKFNETLNDVNETLPLASESRGLEYKLKRTSKDILASSQFIPPSFYGILPPRRYRLFEVSTWSDIGASFSIFVIIFC
jgi:hypothetical protein